PRSPTCNSCGAHTSGCALSRHRSSVEPDRVGLSRNTGESTSRSAAAAASLGRWLAVSGAAVRALAGATSGRRPERVSTWSAPADLSAQEPATTISAVGSSVLVVAERNGSLVVPLVTVIVLRGQWMLTGRGTARRGPVGAAPDGGRPWAVLV